MVPVGLDNRWPVAGAVQRAVLEPALVAAGPDDRRQVAVAVQRAVPVPVLVPVGPDECGPVAGAVLQYAVLVPVLVAAGPDECGQVAVAVMLAARVVPIPAPVLVDDGPLGGGEGVVGAVTALLRWPEGLPAGWADEDGRALTVPLVYTSAVVEVPAV